MIQNGTGQYNENTGTFYIKLEDVFADGCKTGMHTFSPLTGNSTVKSCFILKSNGVEEKTALGTLLRTNTRLSPVSDPHASTVALCNRLCTAGRCFRSASGRTCCVVRPPGLFVKGHSATEQAAQLSNSSSCLQRYTPASAEAKSQRGTDILGRRRVESFPSDVHKSRAGLPCIG